MVLPPGVAGLLVPFRTGFPNTDGALVLVAVIVAVAANGHRMAGLLAAASAAVWFDFLLTRPYERLTITGRGDIETTALLLLVGAAVTELAVRGRRQRVRATTEEAYVAAIRSTTDLVGSDPMSRTVVEHVAMQLSALLDLRSCRFERARFGGLPRLDGDGQLSLGGRQWDVDLYGMPDAEVEIVAQCNGVSYGRYVLTPVSGSVAPLAARQVAIILVNQVGVALSSQSRISH